ncbi:hypothetical protein [Stenotrophomonas maltophilia]|uniref:hypothetical protein n=1 Tax=Stenotrophomonas maltophilia TaxID=40324 RepID=UPI00081041AB|nr:hypothetical protein [Stenotrophomonas maltophilia]MCO7495066.1 hypothetical protein [Stenotrophomonas maltophilia]OCK49075.1 hypothetical protein BA766_03595 [Stenotrophomonas maltophilia]
MDETVYDAAWRAYKAAPRALTNGPSRSAVRAAVDAVLAFVGPEGAAPAYWLATFRQYKENASLCQTLVKGRLPPTLNTLGVTPRPFELVGIEPLYSVPAAQGWVIADGQGARWRMWGSFGPEWTSDRDQALHFARRGDAEAFANDDEDAWLIQPVGAPAQAVDLKKLRLLGERIEQAGKNAAPAAMGSGNVYFRNVIDWGRELLAMIDSHPEELDAP